MVLILAGCQDAGPVSIAQPAPNPVRRCLDVLAVEQDPESARQLSDILGPLGVCRLVPDTTQAEELLEECEFKVLLCADDLQGESGLMFLARTRDKWPMMQRILTAPDLDADLMVHAMREVSVFNYLPKPIDPESARHVVEHGLRQHQLLAGLLATRRDLDEAKLLASRLSSEDQRVQRILQNGPRLVFLIVFVVLLVVVLAMVLLSLLYFLKSLLGIDFAPNAHLRDFLPW